MRFSQRGRLLLFAGAVGVLLAFAAASARISGGSSAQIVLRADPVPVLAPHEHKLSDSVFDDEHGEWSFSDPFIAPEDMWITRFELEVKNAPMLTLHHAGVVVMDEPNQICPGSPYEVYRKEIFSVTPDMAETPVEFPDPYGVFVKQGSPLVLGVMFHNPFPPYGTGEAYKDVEARVRMDAEPAGTSEKRPLEYYRLHIEDDPCPGAVFKEVFTVPASTGEFVKTGEPMNGRDPSSFVFSQSGEVVYMVSHLHPWEGGKRLDVQLNGEERTSFFPKQFGSELWSWVIPHEKNPGIRVGKGDALSIRAVYENPSPVSIPGAMGMLVFYFAPDDE